MLRVRRRLGTLVWFSLNSKVATSVLAIASFAEPLDKTGQSMPSGSVHVGVIPVRDVVLVNCVRFDSFPIVRQSKYPEKAAEKISRKLGRHFQHVTRIVRTQHHLALMPLRHCMTLEAVFIATLFLTQLTEKPQLLQA